MLVYKGVLHLPYGGGNGESFNSLPLVSEEREDYEAPSDEMGREARRLLRRIRRKSLTDDELFRLAMYDNPTLADFFASAYVPDYERGGITRVISDYEIPTASTKSSRLDALAEAGESVIDFEMESGVRGDVLKRTRQYVHPQGRELHGSAPYSHSLLRALRHSWEGEAVLRHKA